MKQRCIYHAEIPHTHTQQSQGSAKTFCSLRRCCQQAARPVRCIPSCKALQTSACKAHQPKGVDGEPQHQQASGRQQEAHHRARTERCTADPPFNTFNRLNTGCAAGGPCFRGANWPRPRACVRRSRADHSCHAYNQTFTPQTFPGDLGRCSGAVICSTEYCALATNRHRHHHSSEQANSMLIIERVC